MRKKGRLMGWRSGERKRKKGWRRRGEREGKEELREER